MVGVQRQNAAPGSGDPQEMNAIADLAIATCRRGPQQKGREAESTNYTNLPEQRGESNLFVAQSVAKSCFFTLGLARGRLELQPGTAIGYVLEKPKNWSLEARRK